MMTKNRIVLAMITLFVLVQVSLTAQYEQDIISIGDRKLTLRNAYKIKDLPIVKDTVVKMDSIEYSVLAKVAPTDIDLEGIKAAKVKVMTPLKRLYRGYVKAGAGTYTTPLFALHYNSLRSRKMAYGIDAHYLSSKGGLKGLAYSGYSDIEGGAWARKTLKKHTLEFGLGYESDKVHYYGVDSQDYLTIDKKDIEHKLNTIKFESTLRSYYKDSSKVHHKIDVSYRNSTDNYDSKENNFKIVADLNTLLQDYDFRLKTTIDYNGFSSLPIEPFDYLDKDINVLDLREKDNNTILELAPQINTTKGMLKVNVGLGIAFDIDHKTSIRLMPRAKARYSLFDNLFSIYAGIDGSVDRNSYYSFYDENPYISSRIGLRNTFTKLKFYGGIRGTVTSSLSFNVSASTAAIDEMPFFYSTDTLNSVENRFDVVYSSGTYSNILGEVNYQQSEKLKVYSSLRLGAYTVKDIEKPWHKPSVEFTIGAQYNIMDKFLVSLDLFSQGKTFAPSILEAESPELYGPEAIEVKGHIDASFKFEYRYTKRVSAFVHLNNVLGQKYERWNNYPVQRLMVLGGLSYSF